MDAHACISKSPSGSYRPDIGYAAIGSVCRHCGVTIKKEHVLLQAIESTE